MEDKWVVDRLDAKVGAEEADKIREAMIRNDGSVDKWLVHVDPNGNTTINKIDAAGNKVKDNVP